MEIEFREIGLDEFFKEFYENITRCLEDEDNITTTSPEKKTRYCYGKPKGCECNTDSSAVKNLNEKIVKLQEDLDNKSKD